MPTNNTPKRIVYVENGIGYGGAIICLRHLVKNLDRDRFLPLVVTGRNGPQYQEIADEALWEHIPDRHIDIVAWRAKTESIHWLTKVPLLRFCLNQLIARSDDLFNFLPFFLHLLWSTWRFKADLIHANNEPLCNRAALLVAKILRIPSICHVRGNPDGPHSARWAYSLPNHFISVSHWVANSMRERLTIPDEKISVVYDGIALNNLNLLADGHAFRQKFNITDDAFAVGLVGLLIPWKGQELFIDAAKSLKDKIPKLKMIIIGGTPDDCVAYGEMLRQRVIKEELTNTIIFTGHIAEMEPLYNGLNIVISASTSPEPLGTVVIEAMAMGRPLIGPDHGGAAEMLNHEETGILFRAKDAEDLSASILKLYQNANFATQLGKKAQIKAFEVFSIHTHTQKIQDIYNRLFAFSKNIIDI
ncbi:glycosyltransferase family 4 protein [Methylomonas albis]|uniref:Glycosyltransferase family 4 protein n=1 Tax=Methylomonas albis TaxID=1854563 RepID=A0ABR9CYF9_9GAMM|nr:glycosyltransferase family 4 protein [Methylomonas albis]MBD9355770.1 glycosyltransferase family 4 protein [Methylomonas albis]